MANIFMRIDGLDKAGAATIEDIGGKKGWFVVNDFSWGCGRAISQDAGNTTDRVSQPSISELSVSRSSDGASPYLTTKALSGNLGYTVELVITKSDAAGDGVVPFMILTLDDALISSYSFAASGGSPSENISISFAMVSTVYYTQDTTGKVTKGDTVKYDLNLNKIVSKAG